MTDQIAPRDRAYSGDREATAGSEREAGSDGGVDGTGAESHTVGRGDARSVSEDCRVRPLILECNL